jgi:hypothetical protein
MDTELTAFQQSVADIEEQRKRQFVKDLRQRKESLDDPFASFQINLPVDRRDIQAYIEELEELIDE